MSTNIDITELEKLVDENQGKLSLYDGTEEKLIVLKAENFYKQITFASDDKVILVTGGAGYIGSHTVKELKNQGYTPLVLDNLSTGEIKSVDCQVVVGDLSDRRLLEKVFDDFNVEAVIHFAASSIVEESVINPAKYFQNNIINGLNLLNVMVKHGVKKIIFSSSAAVYGQPAKLPVREDDPTYPTNPYGETKLMFEKILKLYFQAYETSSVSLRYFNAAGASTDVQIGDNRESSTHLIPRALKVAARQDPLLYIYGNDYPTFDGTAVRDFIHVQDLAEAHILALDKINQDQGAFVYNVGAGTGYSVCQIVDAVIEATGKMVMIENTARRTGDPAVLVADAGKIKEELGFSPKHSDLNTIVQTAWAWHRKRFLKM